MKEFLKYIINGVAVAVVHFFSFFCKRSMVTNGVLIVRTDNIGDFIIFLPYLKKISEYYNSPLTLVVSETVEEFVSGLQERGYPIARIIVVDRKEFNKNFFYKLKFLFKIHQQSYLVALSSVFSRESIGDTIINVSRAKEKIGFSSINNSSDRVMGGLYNYAYTYLISGISENSKEVEKNAYFFSKINKTASEQIIYPEIVVSGKDEVSAEILIKELKLEEKRFILFGPGAAASFRIWPQERYTEVADFINSLGYQVVICGSGNDEQLARGIISCAKSSVINITGKTPIFVLAALLKKSLLFIGSESAVLHLAAAVNTPAICLMGGGHFNRFYPYFDSPLQQIVFDPEMKCMNDNWNCARNIPVGQPSPCINAITVNMVKEKINSLI